MQRHTYTHCFVDESIHHEHGFAVTAMVFSNTEFDHQVADALQTSGLSVPHEEYKSSARMDADPRMQAARNALLHLTNTTARVAVVVGPFSRPRLGRQVLQALQSVVVRNGIQPSGLAIYFDREVFPSEREALRLAELFHALRGTAIHAHQDSKLRFGIQAADAVAHAFGQIIKESVNGTSKMVDIGGPGTGYEAGTMAPLGWELLMQLRYALMTRPVISDGAPYPAECDPAVLDPKNDDPVEFGQHPVLLGWGVQVAPEADSQLRLHAEKALGKLWLGCIH